MQPRFRYEIASLVALQKPFGALTVWAPVPPIGKAMAPKNMMYSRIGVFGSMTAPQHWTQQELLFLYVGSVASESLDPIQKARLASMLGKRTKNLPIGIFIEMRFQSDGSVSTKICHEKRSVPLTRKEVRGH